jgi:hypothetical protein
MIAPTSEAIRSLCITGTMAACYSGTAKMLESQVRVQRLLASRRDTSNTGNRQVFSYGIGRLHLFKVLMNELHRHSAFADCRCNSLYGSGAHVPRSKHTGMTGLQKVRRPRNAPVY